MKLENLHVETARRKAELEHAADLTLPLRVVRPPTGETFASGQCRVHFIQGRLDSNSMQNIGHL
jgi:hypothetical protein